jgi:nucleoside-diphosphate-sugar epimerase
MSVALPPLPAGDLGHVLAHTREFWPQAKGARFFITGGTGFFGVWLLESFAHANDTLGLGMRAVILTRNPAAFAQRSPHLVGRGDLEFLKGDLATFVFPSGKFTHLINCAAETGVWTNHESAAGLLDRIAQGLGHLLDFAVAAQVENFLQVGSGAVYGPQPPEVTHLSEDHPGLAAPLPPGAIWAEGKRLEEALAQAHAGRHGYALKIARGFAFVGPHLPLDANYAIGNFIGEGLRGGPIHIAGDGTPYRSYLYAADLAIWLWTLLFAGPAGRAYNVGSDDGRPIASHARCVAEICGIVSPVEVALAADPARPVARYVPDIRRARAELGLDAWIPEEEGIRRTVAWHRAKQGDFSSPKGTGPGS